MTKQELLLYYGYIEMNFIEHDGLYYFQSTNPFLPIFIIATTFIPNLATPQSTLPLIEFDEANIVGLIQDCKLTVYDETYTIPLKEYFLTCLN